MNDILFEILKLVVMISTFSVTAYLVPWLSRKIGADKLETIARYTKKCVLAAQQVYWAKTGEEKRKTVQKWLQNYCENHHIAITDEQIGILIEAAVKEMKIAEGAGDNG